MAELEPALDIAPLLSPAGDEKRGGDFYVIERTRSGVAVVVGDVMGKGEDAAPCAERARGIVSRRIANCQDPADLLEVLNTDLGSNGGFVERYVACVVFESLVRRPPFGDRDGMRVLWAHLQEGPPDACDERPEVSPKNRKTLKAALDKDPRRRPQTSVEFARLPGDGGRDY